SPLTQRSPRWQSPLVVHCARHWPPEQRPERPSSLLVLQTVPSGLLVQSPPVDTVPIEGCKHDPRQNPSVALKPLTAMPRPICSMRGAVRQTLLAHCESAEQGAPARALPTAAAQNVCQLDPRCVACATQVEVPLPTAAQSLRLRQRGTH